MSFAQPSEAFKQLNSLRNLMLNTLAETWVYRNDWSKRFRQRHLEEAMEIAANQDSASGSTCYPGGVDLSQLDAEELELLNFHPWRAEQYPGFRLIPLWVFPALPPSGTVYLISGQRVDYSPESPLSNDARCGMSAYGVMPLGAPLVRVAPTTLDGEDPSTADATSTPEVPMIKPNTEPQPPRPPVVAPGAVPRLGAPENPVAAAVEAMLQDQIPEVLRNPQPRVTMGQV